MDMRARTKRLNWNGSRRHIATFYFNLYPPNKTHLIIFKHSFCVDVLLLLYIFYFFSPIYFSLLMVILFCMDIDFLIVNSSFLKLKFMYINRNTFFLVINDCNIIIMIYWSLEKIFNNKNNSYMQYIQIVTV